MHADQRILLMTFSRPAATEMTGHAGRIGGAAIGQRAAVLLAGLGWAGLIAWPMSPAADTPSPVMVDVAARLEIMWQ